MSQNTYPGKNEINIIDICELQKNLIYDITLKKVYDWCYRNGNTIWNLDCRLVNIWFTGCACMSIVMTLLVYFFLQPSSV